MTLRGIVDGHPGVAPFSWLAPPLRTLKTLSFGVRREGLESVFLVDSEMAAAELTIAIYCK